MTKSTTAASASFSASHHSNGSAGAPARAVIEPKRPESGRIPPKAPAAAEVLAREVSSKVVTKPEANSPMKRDSKLDAKLDAKAEEAKRGKLAALDRALATIEKAYGKGSIMKLDGDALLPIPSVSTGALSLDLALGGRGLPRGRVIEIYGPESSGKTTLALTVIANAQKSGGVAAFIDAEHALDPSWAKRLGVSIDEMLVSQPDTGEQALEICEMLVRSNAVDIIVIDSVAALIPKAEIEGEMGESQMGLQARLMSQALRKITGAIAKS